MSNFAFLQDGFPVLANLEVSWNSTKASRHINQDFQNFEDFSEEEMTYIKVEDIQKVRGNNK